MDKQKATQRVLANNNQMELIKVLLDENNKFDTEYIIVLSTGKNLNQNQIDKTMKVLNAMVNREFLGRNYYKLETDCQLNLFGRINFMSFYEYKLNNTHCHLILKTPIELKNRKEEILEFMKRSFEQMDSKYDFYKKRVRDDFINKNLNDLKGKYSDRFNNTQYAVKRYDNKKTDFNYF